MPVTRKSVHVKGLAHEAPIPSGARVGNMVFSSAIVGRDPETNTIPDDPDAQAEMLFDNIRRFMEQAGGSTENIGHMAVSLREERYRESINKAWLEMFPDPENRPARHSVKAEIRGTALFQVELIAVL